MEKNDYPIWNKMEDDWIRAQRGEKLKDVHDWKGNVIKTGDEICIIRFKDVQMFKNFTLFLPKDGGGYTEVKSNIPDKEDKDCWEVSEYYKVFSYEEQPSIKVETSRYSATQFVSTMLLFINPRTHLLAIKGISDKTK